MLYNNTNACGFGLGAVLYQMYDDGTDAVIAYTSRILTRLRPTTLPGYCSLSSLSGLQLSNSMSIFMDQPLTYIYINNNPLMYILTTAKLDALSHHWVLSLANYNFPLYYREGKTNIDVDALLRVSWPRCVPDTFGTHH